MLYSNAIFCYNIYQNSSKKTVLYLHRTESHLLSISIQGTEIISHTGLVCEFHLQWIPFTAFKIWVVGSNQLETEKQQLINIHTIACLPNTPSVLSSQWILSCHWLFYTGAHILKDRKLKRKRLPKFPDLSLSNKVNSLHPGDSSKTVAFLNQVTIQKAYAYMTCNVFEFLISMPLQPPTVPVELCYGYSRKQVGGGECLRICRDGQFSQGISLLCHYVLYTEAFFLRKSNRK